MEESLPQYDINDFKLRIFVAGGLIIDSCSRLPQVQYVGGFGSFWVGGKKPHDIDLLLVVKDQVDFGYEQYNLIAYPLKDIFKIGVEMQIADKWVGVIANQVRNFRGMIFHGVDIYGSRPDWLK